MSDSLLHYAGCAFPVEGLGPGRRLAMWVRGCQRHCPGCIAPELWDSGPAVALASVVEELIPYLQQADGLTISGGEPFDQAEALATLLDILRRQVDIEVLIYTGYTREELSSSAEYAALLERVDMLIDGPFVEDAVNTRLWRGSDNQRVHLLSARAQRYREEAQEPMPDARPLQIQMLGAARYRIIGIPRRGDLLTYRAAMAARGFKVAQEHE